MKLCIDASVYGSFKLGDSVVVRALDAADQIIIPAVSLGELYGAFFHGVQSARHILELERFLASPAVRIAPVDAAIAERYGILTRHLQEHDISLPVNHVWVAATALNEGARLATLEGRYRQIPGLVTLNLRDLAELSDHQSSQ